MRISGVLCRLNQENLVTAHGFQNLEADFPILKTGNICLTKFLSQILGNAGCQIGISTSREDLQLLIRAI